MIQPQLRVKLVVAAGVVGASLLAATFVGCQSSQPSQAQNGPYGQFNGNQFAGAPGQQAPQYGGQQMAAAGGAPNGWTPQNQQALLSETQRIGSQPNLSAQDVVAMAHSGVPDQQIATAIQQRGSALRATPGMTQYLAQNGVNPAVLGANSPAMGQPGFNQPGMNPPGAFPGAGGMQQVAMSDPQSALAGNAYSTRPQYAAAPASGVTSAVYPGNSASAGQLQSATYDSTSATPAFDQSAAATGGANGDTWRAMPH
ncbi:MAG TPA: hypothetical protein VHX68_04255 [Planctomycetaceae bacterium]|jgi:hypothetical protein|nr:hypothetical protein [Planctomycetaceae bacterium]